VIRPRGRGAGALAVRRAEFVAVVALVTAGCASGGDDDGGPMVDRIDDAIFAVETEYRAPLDYFEISAGTDRVSVVVAVDDATAAEQAFWSPDDGLIDPVRLGDVDGETFRSSELDFDPDTILERVRDELPDSEIVDFTVIGGPGDAVQYSALIASRQGGSLVVQLDGDGRILGVVTE
jgi:hypothetical protein